MNKEEFMSRLDKGLSGLPYKEKAERLAFYSEMIDDSVEDGMREEDAVANIGNVDEVISQIIAETPMTKIIKERVSQKRKPKSWEVVLLIAGSPVWLPLLLAAVIVALALYIVLWALVISLWAIGVLFAAASVYGVVMGAVYAFSGFAPAGFFLIGMGILSAGLSVFTFYASKAATKGLIALTKIAVLKIKKSLSNKGDAKNGENN